MSFEEERRNEIGGAGANSHRASNNNHSSRYGDSRDRGYSDRQFRDNRDDFRHKSRYYEDISLERDRIITVDQGVRDSRITINCSSKPSSNNSYENTKWSRETSDGLMNHKMSNDQYCLRWNSYETNLLSTFEGLLDSEALSDVTLFCEGESFKAHRLVLAACSAHFSKLFSNSTLNGQLIVILEGTHHQDLQILLQFMYKGVAYLHQDRIESVLRTAEVLQVKGLSDGGVDGVNRPGPRDGPNNDRRPSSRAWSPPARDNDKRDRDMEPPLGPRPNSPKPSGRIAMPDSQLPPSSMPPPIFGSHYNRDTSNLLYQRFGLSRPESSSMKPTSTSFSGPRKADLPSPVGRDAHYAKFSPHRDRDRDTDYDLSSGPSTKSPNDHDRDRSPHGSVSLQRPSSSDQFDSLKPRQMTSDSTTEKGNSPGGEGRRYPDTEPDTEGRNGRRSHDHVKMERGSPEPRSRTFSGDFTRESLSRLSERSNSSRPDSIAAQDLRTTDHEREKQNMERFDTLRRIAESARFAGNNMAGTMQTIRDSFLSPGGFTVPLTAPLGIPASDLARIAQQVPDPASNGDATSGTGTKLKCPFCERTYGYETNLRAHIRQRHQGIRVPCPYCHRSFTRNNTVRRHIAREHRHHVNPKLIPAKFGSKQVLPDQPFQDHLSLSSEQINNLTSQASQPQP